MKARKKHTRKTIQKTSEIVGKIDHVCAHTEKKSIAFVRSLKVSINLTQNKITDLLGTHKTVSLPFHAIFRKKKGDSNMLNATMAM